MFSIKNLLIDFVTKFLQIVKVDYPGPIFIRHER